MYAAAEQKCWHLCEWCLWNSPQSSCLNWGYDFGIYISYYMPQKFNRRTSALATLIYQTSIWQLHSIASFVWDEESPRTNDHVIIICTSCQCICDASLKAVRTSCLNGDLWCDSLDIIHHWPCEVFSIFDWNRRRTEIVSAQEAANHWPSALVPKWDWLVCRDFPGLP